MPKTDKRVDAYIAKAGAHAKPVLETIRAAVHKHCPDCEETIKWGHPNFMYNGGILCGVAAFKAHSHVNFWNGKLFGELRNDESWERLSKVQTVSDLPSKKMLTALIKKAIELSEDGAKPAKAAPKPKPELAMPDSFMAAIKKNKKALATFEKFSPSNRREYVEWITSAKGEDTRERRVAQAVEWMAEGKSRNWKYM
jgi:uncharacterized protein YdeI (YjbR/CyaY-like superfamily)